MIDALLVFVGGLLGSSHCLGMCGGFALALGAARGGLRANLVRQLTYSLGRVFTYTVAGAAAGYLGLRLRIALGAVTNMQALVAIAAGLLLVTQGLAVLGWLRLPRLVTGKSLCFGPTFFAALLRAPGLCDVFVAGVVNGLLPCGLVYAYLALATSSGDMLRGMSVMALFGLGTVPMMVAAGCGASVLSLAGRRRLFHVAAWCVVLTGIMTIARGCGFVTLPGWSEPAGCLLCRP